MPKQAVSVSDDRENKLDEKSKAKPQPQSQPRSQPQTNQPDRDQQRLTWEAHLKSSFGLAKFREGQLAVIEKLMEGSSAAAIFPTGGGKSLCYQFPASLLSGLTVVVSPLLALMREQVDYLNRLGIAAYRLDSSLSADQAHQASRAVQEGKAKLLYVAPERFFNERFRELIHGVPISLFAVDEAHCISQWGHNFRPDYLKLAQIARQLGAERVLALTATATPEVLEDICRQFQIDAGCAIRTPFYRSNLTLSAELCDEKLRSQSLLNMLKLKNALPAIVYVTLQKTAEDVAAELAKQGVQARAYHAGLDDAERRQIQDWFMQSDTAVVVATIAFGMGIDKSNIRSVLHYNPSKSLEAYAQEIGRAGRDGQPSNCHTLLVPEDRVVLENFAYGDTPSNESVYQFTELVAGQPSEFFASYYQWAFDTDIRESVVRTLMTNLELRGLLQSTAPRYETYKFKPRVPSTQILKHFDGERKQFASSVLSMAVKKKAAFEVALTPSATRLKVDRGRIVRMLEYFHERHWIELETSGLVFGYRKLQPVQDVATLSNELNDYLQQRERGEIQRIDQIFSLLSSKHCQNQILSSHFGQNLPKPCGHCGACLGRAMVNMPVPQYPQLGDSAKTAVNRLAKLHPDLLGSVRNRARFLCGLSSPKLTRARLTRDSAFGCCSCIPYQSVLDALQSVTVR